MKKGFFLLIFFLIILQNVNVYASKKIAVEFSKCVDGDTARFLLNNEEIKARFLAIDTPESVHPTKGVELYGKESSEYTCTKLKEAKNIYIEYDPNSDEVDKYDRHLVWIFIDDVLLQKDLISRGYAEVAYLYDDYTYVDELKEAQEIAKNNKIGIWSNITEATKNEESNNNDLTNLKQTLNSIYEILKKLYELLEKIINAVL